MTSNGIRQEGRQRLARFFIEETVSPQQLEDALGKGIISEEEFAQYMGYLSPPEDIWKELKPEDREEFEASQHG